MSLSTQLRATLVTLALASFVAAQSAPDKLATGPQTEARFPPLVVPDGFKATLFACDPLVEYPSVIALGPRFGTVYVAYDYMTGLGTEITRRDEIRLVEDSDGDGYADTSTLFADGFNSIQGLAYHAGSVYAMHAPLLTRLRDTDGDGKADERVDLLRGLGLEPENNPSRLHCANGVVVGHDGWLYLAMGDNGTNVLRPEGDRLVHNAGCILRCRPDGRDLHVFSTGLRNIYDIALDEELNVFVRDNENDGGDYMIRVYHSFFGADHGYPFLYRERPDEALAPLADLGRGSSAGMVCYLETAFPEEYRGNLFCCEWGRAVVRCERKRQGSSFAPMQEIDFATGAPNDPYGFKPTDVIVDYDGSLLVSDWCDGQRPKRGRGRIYRIAYGESRSETSAPAIPRGIAAAIKQLNSPSYHARVAAQEALQSAWPAAPARVRTMLEEQALGLHARLHAVWILSQATSPESLAALAKLSKSDVDPRVRAQAVRATADCFDPVLNEHRLEPDLKGERGAPGEIPRKDADMRVALEAIIALGRGRYAYVPRYWESWISEFDKSPEPALRHALVRAFRLSGERQRILRLTDERVDRPLREIALRSFADQAETWIVDHLIEQLRDANFPDSQRGSADLLTRVYKKPAPWTYWGYRPAPRSANSVDWERTNAIEAALDQALTELDPRVRLFILQRMQREQIPVRMATLQHWLKKERDAERVTAILTSLAEVPSDESRELLAGMTSDATFAAENRTAALEQFIAGLDDANEQRLLALAERLEDGPLVVKLLDELSRRPKLDSRALLLAKLDTSTAEGRAAALSACAALKVSDAAARVPTFLQHDDAGVRRAAAIAAGALSVKEATPALMKLSHDDEPTVRSASLDALRRLREPSAIDAALTALEHPTTQFAAIEYLGAFGAPEHTAAVTTSAASQRSMDVLSAVARALTNWERRESPASPRRAELLTALANVQGQCGVVLGWHVVGSLDTAVVQSLREQLAPFPAVPARATWQIASGAEGRIDLPSPRDISASASWLAVADVSVSEATRAQFLAGSNSPFQVWLNGRSVHQRDKAANYLPDGERFQAELAAGMNRIVVELGPPQDTEAAQFHLRFRPLSSSAQHERLTQYLLQNTGNVDRGRELFLNAEKSLCLKCHRLGDQGGAIGPNLTGVGSRFARIHLIESILEPSRTIAPSYDTVSVALASGRVIHGVKIAEDDKTLVLGDETGQRHEVALADIDERIIQRRSTMPEGLEKRLNDREFLDLLSFLVAERKSDAR
jgi:putative membrane-bound dehydrogenase-like protein